MSNKDSPGNESFTISLPDLNEILISTIKFLKRLLTPQGYMAL